MTRKKKASKRDATVRGRRLSKTQSAYLNAFSKQTRKSASALFKAMTVAAIPSIAPAVAFFPDLPVPKKKKRKRGKKRPVRDARGRFVEWV